MSTFTVYTHLTLVPFVPVFPSGDLCFGYWQPWAGGSMLEWGVVSECLLTSHHSIHPPCDFISALMEGWMGCLPKKQETKLLS